MLLAKLEEGKAMARIGLMGLRAQIKSLDVGAGLGVIYANNHFEEVAKLLTPKEEGDFLMMDMPSGGGPPMVALLGVAASVAIPAFIKYTRRAKTTEAIDGLDKIYKGAAIYYSTPKVDQTGSLLPCQFPADQGVTPVQGTCCAALGGPDNDGDNRCDVNTSLWDTPTWSALYFQMTDQNRFVYAFDSNGKTGPDAQFTASAYGDLDCDGVMSTFQRMGFGDPSATMGNCSLQGSAAFYVEQETE